MLIYTVQLFSTSRNRRRLSFFSASPLCAALTPALYEVRTSSTLGSTVRVRVLLSYEYCTSTSVPHERVQNGSDFPPTHANVQQRNQKNKERAACPRQSYKACFPPCPVVFSLLPRGRIVVRTRECVVVAKAVEGVPIGCAATAAAAAAAATMAASAGTVHPSFSHNRRRKDCQVRTMTTASLTPDANAAQRVLRAGL